MRCSARVAARPRGWCVRRRRGWRSRARTRERPVAAGAGAADTRWPRRRSSRTASSRRRARRSVKRGLGRVEGLDAPPRARPRRRAPVPGGAGRGRRERRPHRRAHRPARPPPSAAGEEPAAAGGVAAGDRSSRPRRRRPRAAPRPGRPRAPQVCRHDLLERRPRSRGAAATALPAAVSAAPRHQPGCPAAWKSARAPTARPRPACSLRAATSPAASRTPTRGRTAPTARSAGCREASPLHALLGRRDRLRETAELVSTAADSTVATSTMRSRPGRGRSHAALELGERCPCSPSARRARPCIHSPGNRIASCGAVEPLEGGADSGARVAARLVEAAASASPSLASAANSNTGSPSASASARASQAWPRGRRGRTPSGS